MLNRRKFSALCASLLVSLGYKACTTKPVVLDPNASQKLDPKAQSPLFKSQPNVILSTWENIEANKTAADLLANGRQLISAVEAGINTVENNTEDQSVGFGGKPDREGNVTLDACIMDSQGNAGSVTYLAKIKNAISVARKVMEKTPHVILSGAGALKFALNQGFKEENLLTEKSKAEYKEWLKLELYAPEINIESHDTIGLLAQNSDGDLAGGCSTSGLAYKMDGRVGDSPIIGAGLYVDNEIGAAAATGLGELVLRKCSSFLTVELMRAGKTPQVACKEAIMRIVNKTSDVKDAQVGLIAIDKLGNVGAYSIHPGFVYTLTRGDQTEKLSAVSYFT